MYRVAQQVVLIISFLLDWSNGVRSLTWIRFWIQYNKIGLPWFIAWKSMAVLTKVEITVVVKTCVTRSIRLWGLWSSSGKCITPATKDTFWWAQIPIPMPIIRDVAVFSAMQLHLKPSWRPALAANSPNSDIPCEIMELKVLHLRIQTPTMTMTVQVNYLTTIYLHYVSCLFTFFVINSDTYNWVAFLLCLVFEIRWVF